MDASLPDRMFPVRNLAPVLSFSLTLAASTGVTATRVWTGAENGLWSNPARRVL